jgi:hypothetical protein
MARGAVDAAMVRGAAAAVKRVLAPTRAPAVKRAPAAALKCAPAPTARRDDGTAEAGTRAIASGGP